MEYQLFPEAHRDSSTLDGPQFFVNLIFSEAWSVGPFVASECLFGRLLNPLIESQVVSQTGMWQSPGLFGLSLVALSAFHFHRK